MRAFYLAAGTLVLNIVIASSVLAGPLASVSIAPKSVGLVAGAKQQFTVIGVDADGNEVTVPSPVTWSANARVGTVTSAGLLTASYTPGKYRDGVSVSVPGGFGATADVEVYSNEVRNGFAIERSLGSLNAGQIDTPAAITLDRLGNLYVLSRNNNVVNKLDPRGNYMSQIQLASPVGTGRVAMALDRARNLYVLNASISKIQKYSADGSFLTEWGSEGTADGQLKNPKDIATSADGNVYVADYGNKRIQVFGPSGTFVTKYLSKDKYGTECFPQCIAFGSDGCLYVAVTTYDGEDVQKLDSHGKVLSRIIDYCGVFPGLGIACDTTGALYGLNGEAIYRCNAQCKDIITQFSGPTCIDELVGRPSAMAVDCLGRTYMAEENANRIRVYNPNGTLSAVYSSTGAGNGQFNSPCGIVADALGNFYIADTGNYRVQKFGANMGFAGVIASRGARDSLFACPAGLSVDSQNKLYLTNALSNGLLTYTSAGALQYNWALPEPADDTAINASPMGVVYDSRSYVWVVDSYFNCIRKLSTSGSVLGTYGTPGTGNGQFTNPAGIALDSSGNVFVTDYGNNRVQKFTSSGVYASKFGAAGSGNGQLQGPCGISVDSSNYMYVADSDNCRIQKFASTGSYTNQLGTRGYGKFEMSSPTGVHIDKQGALWVADTFNHRMLKYVTAGTRPISVTISSPTANDTYTTVGGTVSISGTTTGSVTSVTWSNDRGATGTCTGTASWSANGIVLTPGPNVIAVAARDASGNAVTDSFTVVMNVTNGPTISITSPTANPDWITNSQILNISGTASSSNGVASVTWYTDSGTTGTCTGTTAWNASITLQPGFNQISVGAQDLGGLSSSDTLSVYYAPASPTTIAGSKRLNDFTYVYLPSVTVSAVLGGCCYLQDVDGFTGIRFNLSEEIPGLIPGMVVDAAGTIIGSRSGERYISGGKLAPK